VLYFLAHPIHGCNPPIRIFLTTPMIADVVVTAALVLCGVGR